MPHCVILDRVHVGVSRLQHEVDVLQLQLSESKRLISKLECEQQSYLRTSDSVNTGKNIHLTQTQNTELEFFNIIFPLSEHDMGLREQQLSERLDHGTSHTTARKRLFHGEKEITFS